MACQILMDTMASPATCTATLASTPWEAVAIGLRPTIISGTALNTALVMVNNSFSYNSVTVELVGSGTLLAGAVTFEVSIDNVHWSGLLGTNVTTGVTMSTAVFTLTSGTTCLSFNNTGFQYMRARLSTQIAGYLGQVVISYTVQGLASPNVNSNISTGSITVNGNQGTPASLANSWPMEITDGTNGPTAVKPSSTPAAAADAALVVSLSPNSPLPTPSVVAVNSQTWVTTVGGTSAQVTVTGYTSVLVSLVGSGTITTGAAAFEASDDGGATWWSIVGRRNDATTTGSTATLTTTAVTYQFNVAGYTTFRVRNSVTITGSGGQVIVRAQASTAYFLPTVDVANTAGGNLNVNQVASGTIAIQASQVSAITNTTTTRTTTTTIQNYNTLCVLINITSGGVATGVLQLFIQDSMDGGTTWNDLISSNPFTFGASPITQTFYLAGLVPPNFATQGAAAQTEALAAGIVRSGPWGDRLRVREKVSGISGSPTGVTYAISATGKV